MKFLGAKNATFVLVFLSLIFSFTLKDAVFATDPTLTLTASDEINLSIIPGVTSLATGTITAETDNESGYTIIPSVPGIGDLYSSELGESIPVVTLDQPGVGKLFDEMDNEFGYSLDAVHFYPLDQLPETTLVTNQTNGGNPNQYTLTVGANVDLMVSIGEYTTSIELTMVANDPLICLPESICYYGNGDDGTVGRFVQEAESNTEVMLTPPNFSKPGYAFDSWNTEADGSGTRYAPSQTITLGDISDYGFPLYAQWRASSDMMQNWTGCSALATGDAVALTDMRDNNTYLVAKLGDGKCWQVENMRIVPQTAKFSVNNTNNPTNSFITEAKASTSIPTFCSANTAACINQIQYNANNIDRSLDPAYNVNVAGEWHSWYSYGVYYNWYTATAGHGVHEMASGNTAGDICPVGWRLPTGGTSGDYGNLNQAINRGRGNTDVIYHEYPNNFSYSGNNSKLNADDGRATFGRQWTSSVVNNSTAYRLGYGTATLNNKNYNKWAGMSVRCLVKDNIPSITGNIVYDANGGSGTMENDEDVPLYTTLVKENTFTMEGGTFYGWNTAADNSGYSVNDGDLATTVIDALGLTDDGTLTLYAIWGTTITLTFDAAPSTTVIAPISENTLTGQVEIMLPATVPTYYEHVFLGWSFTEGATTADYQPGDTVTLNSDSAIYAIYTPESCAAKKICYRGNGATAGMALIQNVNSSATVTLGGSDYSREGYGFIGYNTEEDGSGTYYGPQQSYTTGDLATEGVNLFAQWLPSAGNMQSFTSCGTMSVGDITALTDTRDGNVYAVAKLADGKCWMIENMRLDPVEAEITAENTNNPDSTFLTRLSTLTASEEVCNTDNDATCTDRIFYNTNNINRSLTPSSTSNSSPASWYSYGVYYNWYTATAGNGTYSKTSGNVTGDICPKGWRLPTGGSNNSDLVAITAAINNGNATNDPGFRSFPANFVYNGDLAVVTASRGGNGRYWTSTAKDNNNAYRLGIPTKRYNEYKKWDGFGIRCVTE